MKFIADVMLGRLAKWLRILGYDTLYDSHSSDDELFFKTHKQKRILLTRDTELAQRMNPEYCLFITESSVLEQVKQVVEYYHLSTVDYLFSRCTLCNDLVKKIPKELAKDRVPDFVLDSIDKFYYCESCDKFYWAGSHIKLVQQVLSKISSLKSR